MVARCRRNDRAAQMEIYKKYSKAMYNTALRIVKDTTEAEDLMQEAFIDAFRKIRQFQFKSAFGAWLKRIVVNKSLDAVRQHIQFEDIDEIPEPADYNEEKAHQEQMGYHLEEVKKAIYQLEHKDRVIISLYLFEGYDHEEIAQILEISHNAARTRYSRARKNLVNLVKENRTMKTFLS